MEGYDHWHSASMLLAMLLAALVPGGLARDACPYAVDGVYFTGDIESANHSRINVSLCHNVLQATFIGTGRPQIESNVTIYPSCLGIVHEGNRVFEVTRYSIRWENEDWNREGSEGHQTVSVAVSVMLFIMMCLIIGALYLVNCSDPEIRMNSIYMISETMAVFCAVMINQSIKSVLVDQIFYGKKPRMVGFDPHNPHFYVNACLGLAVALSFWSLTILLAWRARHKTHFCFISGKDNGGDASVLEQLRRTHRRHRAQAFCHLGGHCAAFAGIYAVHELMKAGKRSHTSGVLWALWTVGVASVAFLVLQRVMLCIQRALIRPNLEDEWDTEFFTHFQHVVQHAEIHSIVLIVSFAVNQLLSETFLHGLPSLHSGNTLETTWSNSHFGSAPMTWHHVHIFFILGGLFFVCNFGVHAILERMRRRGAIKFGRYHVAIKAIALFLAMSMSWCLQWASVWGMQLCFQPVTKVVTPQLAHVINAVAVSAGSVLTIFVLDKLADAFEAHRKKPGRLTSKDAVQHELHLCQAAVGQGLRGIICAFGLLVALSWDRAFDAALETADEGANLVSSRFGFGVHDVIYKGCLSGIMVIIVGPAWYWFLAPQVAKSDDEYHEEHQSETCHLCDEPSSGIEGLTSSNEDESE